MTIQSFQIITDYLVTGKAPEGLRPAFLDAIATIIQLEAEYREIKDAPMLPTSFEYVVRDQFGNIALQTNDFRQAKDMLRYKGKHAYTLDHDTLVVFGRPE